ncbi:hypothetical protein [Nocardia testacea]|uniref:hypothetical protein n=1 Tax=Nocardia testacea TaxID=248551 RepID=UPI0002E5E3D4|nr:hypothetical protein [Nocardia testacea]
MPLARNADEQLFLYTPSTTLLLIATSRTSVSMGRFSVAATRTLQLLQSPDP